MTWACSVPWLTHWAALALGRCGQGRQGGSGAAHLSIMDLKSSTPSMSLAANLEDEAEM